MKRFAFVIALTLALCPLGALGQSAVPATIKEQGARIDEIIKTVTNAASATCPKRSNPSLCHDEFSLVGVKLVGVKSVLIEMGATAVTGEAGKLPAQQAEFHRLMREASEEMEQLAKKYAPR